MEIEKLKDMLRNAAGGPVGIQMCQEAADALEQLQAENDRLGAELEKEEAARKKQADILYELRGQKYESTTAIDRLRAENDRLRRDRDAAVAGLHGRCDACQHYTLEHGNDICGSCIYEYPLFHRDGVVIKDLWQWAGIKEVKRIVDTKRVAQ